MAEQKTKLADKWVTSNLPPERFHQLRQDLEKEEARLISIRAAIDPAQIQELETTGGLLRFWQKQVDSMAWNTEEEDGRMVRLVDAPHRAVLRLAGLESSELSEYRRFPATRRELLQKLQVQAVVFHDKIDVEALFPIEPVYHQKSPSPYRRGRGHRGWGYHWCRPHGGWGHHLSRAWATRGKTSRNYGTADTHWIGGTP